MNVSEKIKIVAVAIAATVILGTTGTFAWTSISQRALNEGGWVREPGARVHDDYEGFENILLSNGGLVNKDVFAENYSNKPVYARIKLTEYMETGEGAGKYTVSGTDNTMSPSPENKSKVLANAGLNGAVMIDRSTWAPYLPNGNLSTGTKSDLRQYITWDLGDDNTDRKVYMPTFNENNENQESDTTGKAIEELTWTMNGNYDTTQNALPGTHDQWKLGEKHVSDLKKYDEKTAQEVVTIGIEHTAVSTVIPERGGYVTMADWKLAGQPTGNFWVHDVDGWIYWASPIGANSATSLLLDKLDISFTNDDMYYAINVASNFATSDSLGAWTGVSADAADLLAKINDFKEKIK